MICVWGGGGCDGENAMDGELMYEMEEEGGVGGSRKE